ncbi:hypothetical protein LQ327_05560 [Actinomycetospora endophytica]|uniref:DUF7455 domain-containing protein n=1 Tax=Actinomycetospora endophytica TaxID=2291215 RepID=A0ABS8P3M0_9PSEU|nr:hypothetical protein [Actinomycetospora endophytica]MCD2192854.1 hypothetical protein [Actinomycetospora endophytica]
MTAFPDRPRQRSERCDRCGGLGRYLASFPRGGELVFCSTHLRMHRERLLVTGAQVGLLADRLVVEADMAA